MIKILNFQRIISHKIKKILYVGIINCFVISLFTVFAQTEKPVISPTVVEPTESIEDKEIQNLKDKIATKVAELRVKNSRAVSGIVQETPSPQGKIKIKTTKGEDFTIKIDQELIKFYQIQGSQKKEVKLSSIKKDSYILVTGIIKENTVDANIIYLDEKYIVGLGTVIEVNKDDFFIKVITSDKANYTLDVETFTKQQLLNIKTLKFENVGFSKIKEGDMLQFVVKHTGEEREVHRYSAQKILIIPQEYFTK